MENPIKIDDLGKSLIFGNTHMLIGAMMFFHYYWEGGTSMDKLFPKLAEFHQGPVDPCSLLSFLSVDEILASYIISFVE